MRSQVDAEARTLLPKTDVAWGGNMVERKHRYGNLVFDRDAIVRAAVRAYLEAIFGQFPFRRLSSAACDEPRWTGDLQQGAFYNGGACGDYNVVASRRMGLAPGRAAHVAGLSSWSKG